jgi:beta-lactamase class A
MKKYLWPVLFVIIGCLLGGLVDNFVLHSNSGASNVGGTDIRAGESGSSLINPLLECNFGQDYISANSVFPFKSKIQSVIDVETAKGDINYGGYYFADLNAGTWFGINSSDNFRPASLLKVPLMMALMGEENETPGYLDKSVVYDGSNLDLTQNIAPEKQVVSGQKYTMWQLIQYMIVYSDNRATSQLLKLVDPNDLVNLFANLGIEFPSSAASQVNFISLRQYASFFQVLFNSSYLNNTLSQKALMLLTQVDFQNGIVGGVPANIKIAHKFGESTESATGMDDLYDCGIVYYPEKPYLICVTTKGTSFAGLEKAVQDISQATYNEVDKQVKNQGV